METLRKLERVQGMLSFMQARGISAGQPDTDRFLAEFLLFLVRPSTVNLGKRCQLIHEYLPKISAVLLEETSRDFTLEDCREMFAEPSTHLSSDNKIECCSSNTDEDLPLIGLNAMQRANSTLEDFCRSYFMFHGMEVSNPQSIFKFLPVLSFTESYIYQLDIINEKSLKFSVDELNGSGSYAHAMNSTYNLVGSQDFATHVPLAFVSNPFDPLLFLLQQRGLLTKQYDIFVPRCKLCSDLFKLSASLFYLIRIKEELESGVEYWALERRLCHALSSNKKISLEDVMRATHLKSFDYRVLHLLLYQLRGEEVNELHMKFLSVSEFLVEVSDDLYDYEDDVVENSFNVLRMFVRVYGPQIAPSMLAKCISEAEEKYESLLRALDSDLSSNYQRRCEEATREGGKTSGYTFGTWNIPSVIADEGSYRSRVLNLDAMEN